MCISRSSVLEATDPVVALERAARMPVDGTLFAALSELSAMPLDAEAQVRLAEQWSRVEAAAAGRKLTAIVAFVTEPLAEDELIDFRDLEVSSALRLGLNSARTVIANATTLAEQTPTVLAAMRAGQLGYLQGTQYAEATAGLTADQAARVVELTLEKALSKAPGELRRLLRRAVVRVGAEDFARRHRTEQPSVGVWVRPDADGMSNLSARLSSADAAIVDAAVEAYARAAKASSDERTLDELRAAGLVDFAARYLMAPNGPRAHGRPITVLIAMDLLTFLGLTDHPGEVLSNGEMIPAEALRELIPQAELRRIITDPMTGHLLDYGRSTYRFPPATTGYLVAKWVTSTAPGSLLPADRGDIDHGIAWEDGGTTDRDNGNPCGRRWHRAKTIGGWTVTQRDNRWVWTSPLGLHYETEPHDYRLGP